MKKILISIVVMANAITQIHAKQMNDTIHSSSDSLKSNFRFEFRKPYIGWEIMGPSNILALTYQQQFMRLGKKSFLDYQILINNRNVFFDEQLAYDPYDETKLDNHGLHKFAFYLTQRNQPLRWLNLELSAGFLYFQEWKYWTTNFSLKNYCSAYFILKASISALIARNFGFKINVNQICSKEENDIPYLFYMSNLNLSGSLLFGFNKKDKKANYEKVYSFNKNQFFVNLTKLQIGYERFLLNRSDFNVSASIATHAIPFKRYGKYSYKKGYETLTDAMVNFNYSLGKQTYSFVGIGGFINYVTYYVLSDKYDMQTYGLRSNIGIAFKLDEQLSLKFAYMPYITKDININIEHSKYFLFFRIFKLNAILSWQL